MLRAQIERFAADESAATAVEYGLLAAIMGLGLVATFTLLGNNLAALFDSGVGAAANAIATMAAGP